MKYETVTEPTSLCVPIADLKAWPLYILDDDKNDALTALSGAAERFVENATNRFFLTRTIDAYFDDFDDVVISHRPNVAVTSVKYFDVDGIERTMSASDYSTDVGGLDTRLEFDNPPSLGDVLNPITVRYTVGYGTASDVPEPLKVAIKGMVAHWYENPAPVIVGTISAELPLHVETIINQYRVVEV